MSENTIYYKNLSEPWFSMISIGRKMCEGRLRKNDFANIKVNDIIIFENNDFGYKRNIKVCVNWIKFYDNFEELLTKEMLDRCLPGADTIENGKKIYYNYYSPEDEEKYKVVALHIGKIF